MEKKKSSSRGTLSGQSSSERDTSRVVGLAGDIVTSKTFDWIITGVILLQAFALALEATPAILSVGKDDELLEAGTFVLIQSLVVAVFIVEAALRLIALYPRPQSISETLGIALILQS